MTRTVCHEETIVEPNFDNSGSGWTDTDGIGTSVYGAGKVTFTGWQGNIEADVVRAIAVNELYHWVVIVDSATIGTSVFTVEIGGDVVQTIAAAGIYQGSVRPTGTHAPILKSTTGNLTAVVSRFSCVKHGHGLNPVAP
jgi:hypothetical protein